LASFIDSFPVYGIVRLNVRSPSSTHPVVTDHRSVRRPLPGPLHFHNSSANTRNDETKKEKWEKCRAVNTALCEVGWISVYGMTMNNKSHAPAWQVLNNRRSVSDPVTGSVIQGLTFHEHFSENLANMDKIGISKYFWF